MPRRDDVSAVADDQAGDGALDLAYLRSRRSSRARRATAALRRRRTLRSRRSTLIATTGMMLFSACAVAGSTGGASAGDDLSRQTIVQAQRALGVEADGVIGPDTRRAVRRFQRKHDLPVDGRLWPSTLKALGVDPGEPRAESSAVLDPRLEKIAQCESGGDPTAVSASGRYRGKYQFDRATWRSVGGRGDPAKASEGEQDRRAAKLLAREGTAPWPNCA